MSAIAQVLEQPGWPAIRRQVDAATPIVAKPVYALLDDQRGALSQQ